MVPWLLMSGVVSLISASAGLASVLSERAWERFAAATAIFFTLGKSPLHNLNLILVFYFHSPIIFSGTAKSYDDWIKRNLFDVTEDHSSCHTMELIYEQVGIHIENAIWCYVVKIEKDGIYEGERGS